MAVGWALTQHGEVPNLLFVGPRPNLREIRFINLMAVRRRESISNLATRLLQEWFPACARRTYSLDALIQGHTR